MKTTLLKLTLPLLITLSAAGCKTQNSQPVIYPAGLISMHPKGFLGCYITVEGKLTDSWPQDLFPPNPGDLPVCDNSGCVFIHYPYEELSKYLGKRVRVEGFGAVSTFNFPYIDAYKVELLNVRRSSP